MSNNQLIHDEIKCEKQHSSTQLIHTNSDKFLGIVEKRYIRTFHGIVHGLASTIALILGNFVFANRVLLGNQGSIEGNTMNTIFHACNFVASAITAIFFWNKVQAWQLSKTTMEQKGLTRRILQRFNKGRGVVTMLIYSLFPLVCSTAPQYILEDSVFSTGLALALIGGSAYAYHLIKEYGAHLWLVYGMNPMAMGISILSSAGGTVASVNENSPLAMDRLQKDASFVISCVQLGFMMYYLYSRKLVTQQQVQKVCKTYHVSLVLIYLVRMERDIFAYNFTDFTTVGSIPIAMLVHPMILSLGLVIRLGGKMGKKILATKQTQHAHSSTPTTTTDLKSSVQKLQSTVLVNTAKNAGSLAARVDVLTSCNGVSTN